MLIENLQPRSWDESRDFIVPGDHQTTLIFCVEHFIALSRQAIKDHGAFFVALSGGSTPKAIFEHLTSPPYDERIAWNHLHLFWSDERAVPPDHLESNYHMAMEAGLRKMPIPQEQIHRMRAEDQIEENAYAYEKEISLCLKQRPFDLIMLGVGEDGHTASLFPQTDGLHVHNRLVISNFIPEKKSWRMTLTFSCINQASNIVVYVLGASKKSILAKILLPSESSSRYPVQSVGTPARRALWIADEEAASELIEKREN